LVARAYLLQALIAVRLLEAVNCFENCDNAAFRTAMAKELERRALGPLRAQGVAAA